MLVNCYYLINSHSFLFLIVNHQLNNQKFKKMIKKTIPSFQFRLFKNVAHHNVLHLFIFSKYNVLDLISILISHFKLLY
jgi:hypothetical protein